MKYVKLILVVVLILAVVVFAAIKWLNINPPIKLMESPISSVPIDSLILPEGFQIEVYAENVTNARSMCLSPKGTLFVGTRSEGKVYAIQDLDGDYKADTVFTIYKGGNMPNGVAFKDGNLYIAEVDRVIALENIESNLGTPPEPVLVFEGYPNEKHHGWKYIAFGPDGKLYIPVGAPCNICESKEAIYNSISRLDINTKEREIVQSGIRNTVGFDWHPVTGHLWFTDNGRDMMGDEIPNCELNVAPKDSMHFGFPYCHQGDLLDPEFGKGKDCGNYTPPAAKLGPHTAPLGIEWNDNTDFGFAQNTVAFIARHGSWNRSKKIGYDVIMVTIDSNNVVVKQEPFITGWLDEKKDNVWGRPVDVEFLKDGSLLVSDDFANVIYRVTYTKR